MNIDNSVFSVHLSCVNDFGLPLNVNCNLSLEKKNLPSPSVMQNTVPSVMQNIVLYRRSLFCIVDRAVCRVKFKGNN
jgi:hypothetical protein